MKDRVFNLYFVFTFLYLPASILFQIPSPVSIQFFLLFSFLHFGLKSFPCLYTVLRFLLLSSLFFRFFSPSLCCFEILSPVTILFSDSSASIESNISIKNFNTSLQQLNYLFLTTLITLFQLQYISIITPISISKTTSISL